MTSGHFDPPKPRRVSPRIKVAVYIRTDQSMANLAWLEGLVMADGDTPAAAMDSLRSHAEQVTVKYVQNVVAYGEFRTAQKLEVVSDESVLDAVVSIQAARLAPGPLGDGRSGWVAYGTLLAAGSWLTLSIY